MRGRPRRWPNGVMTQAYITGVGAYLPGDPIDNEQLADQFGDGTRREAALRRRTLAANGIRTPGPTG